VRSRSPMESFRHAIEGLAYVLYTHRHMRYHFLIGAVVLLVSAIFRVTRVELLLLVVAITLVVLAELVNTALETVVDLVSPEFHPLAKVAKDIGGGCVLVACIGAVLIGSGVFVRADVLERLQVAQARPAPHVLHIVLVGLTTVVVAVILGKLWGGRGTLFRGGLVSAHSALAFFCFVSVCYLSGDVLVWSLSFVLALLVAQSRVETGVHTLREVLIGGAVALAVGGGLYGVLSMRGGG
jgi:diacylglycerol kinase (ATP)